MQTLDLLTQNRLKPNQIAIATSYQAQYEVYKAALRQLQTTIPNTPVNGIRIRKIDGYQGRESTLIILDLVITDRLGFVKDASRLNIALMRAKDGLIISQVLASHYPDPLLGHIIPDTHGVEVY